MNILYRAFMLLISVTTASGVSNDEFSVKLRKLVDDLLGIQEFQKYVDGRDFKKVTPDGRRFTQIFADELNRKVEERADVVRELQRTIVDAFSKSERPSSPIVNCCPEAPLNLTDDPRYSKPTNHEIMCHYGKEPSPSELVTGISDKLLSSMKRHARSIPSLKWQYFGNQRGTLYTYPAVGTCDVPDSYDPRFRPWYGFAATYPKDLVIMIDNSKSMTSTFDKNSRLYYAIKAAQWVIDTLNPYDHIGVLAFADDVKFPMDRCYMRGLSLATPTNKKKLKNEFIARIHGSISSEARYSSAFSEAFRLLATVSADADNASEPSMDQREKVIILLSDGSGSSLDTLSAINQTIAAGRRLAGRVIILAFGVLTRDSSSVSLLQTVSNGFYTALDEPDEEAMRRKIGVYNSFFTKPTDDDSVIFSVPYIGSQGLGLIISECLPVFALSKFQGVTCADLKVDTFFSEIIDFRLEQLSYAFLVDSRGRIQIHPLLPRPTRYPEEPIFLNMESVEISSEIGSIKESMLSGIGGSMSIDTLQTSVRRGYSPLEGVTSEPHSVTYFWSPIELMNASVAIVIVDNEKNISLLWTKDFPPVYFTDEISANDGECNNFGRVALRDKTAVKISLRSFKDSYYYNDDRLPALKSYLQDKSSQQGQLAVKPGVRESVALTYELERIWNRSAPASSGLLSNYTLYRYVGTREGVYRVYPAVRVPLEFEPTKQPQYIRAAIQRDRTVVYSHKDNSGNFVSSFAKAFVDPSKSVTLGVVGADVAYYAIYNFLTTQFEPCRLSTSDCFAIDRCGFVIIHNNFLTSPPTSRVHITTIEQDVAADMVSKNILTSDTCVRYLDITNQMFWKVALTDRVQRMANSDMYSVEEFDLFIIVKHHLLSPVTGTCLCNPIIGDHDVPKCEAGRQCQCPCYTATDYSYCSGHFTITNTTKACYPKITLPALPNFPSKERDVAKSLTSCIPCSSFNNSQSACTINGCCWSANIACSRCLETETDEASGSSCDSVCLGLVIGLVLLIILIAVVVVVVIILKRRKPLAKRPHKGQHVSNVMVIPSETVSGGGNLSPTYDYVNPISIINTSDSDSLPTDSIRLPETNSQKDIESQYITVNASPTIDSQL